jgi:glutamate-ammonia-ligase adenylyltransferase
MRRMSEEDQAAVMQPMAHATLPQRDQLPMLDSRDIDACQRHLRHYKRRSLCQIIWWELGLHADPVCSWRAISDLADSLLEAALGMAERLLEARFGTLVDGTFCVIGLGKLGGQELNMGSDVDLLFVWQGAGSTQGGRKSLPAAEYYAQLSRMLIRLIDEATNDGQVWPVDMRLRPGGASAAITLSLDATLDHYLEYGQTWERAMLLKARHVAGDADLAAALLHGLMPFKFRRYLDYTTVTALVEMKRRIDHVQGSADIGSGFDVKRGYGGIREIEFTVQAMQLLHGGRNIALRQYCNTLEALHALQQASVVAVDEANSLRQSYIFWRRVEHGIQARHGEQTQRLAADYHDWMPALLAMPTLTADMQQHAQQVHLIFSRRLLPEESAHTSTHWLSGEGLTHCPEDVRSAMQQSMAHICQYLQRGLLPERSHDQIERLLQHLMPQWLDDDNGVQALAAFADLIHTIGGRATWIDLLDHHQGTRQWLAGVLSASRYVASHIVRDPSWLEWPLSLERGAFEVSRLCAKLHDLDAAMDDDEFLAELGHAVDQVRLHSALAIDAHECDALQVAAWLSDVADAATGAAIRYNAHRLGLPQDFPFVALAMGKHGSREMGLVSDLDMVFVLVTEDDRTMFGKRNMRDWAQRLGRRVIQTLTAAAPFGAGYEFDARLRPSGNSGVLVVGLKTFVDYQQHEAQTWEHQALCRARAVAGPTAACEQLTASIRTIISQARDEQQLAVDIRTMRQKMLNHLAAHDDQIINLKHDAGGLVDIEFLAQWSILRFGGEHQGTVATLRHIPSHAPAAWREVAASLADDYLAYRAMENALRVELWQSIGSLPGDANSTEWKTLSRHCTITTPLVLRQRMDAVHQHFQHWLG